MIQVFDTKMILKICADRKNMVYYAKMRPENRKTQADNRQNMSSEVETKKSASHGGIEEMFRLWAKEVKDNRMLRDTVICDETDDTRTHKIFHALDEVCYEFDLSKPIWLDATVSEFKRHAKARFYQDNFVDEIDFDYLEIQIIEEG